jgi:5'-nucleotidase
MSYDLSNVLVVGISSRALFDLEEENELFTSQGLDAYTAYQIENINNMPRPGTGFRLIKNILSLNEGGKNRKVEVIVLSRNNPATSLRIIKAIQNHDLDITRSAWTGGESIVRYLGAYKVDLFLSAHQKDVQRAINAGFAAARIYKFPKITPVTRLDKKMIKIAFDGDAVLFSAESEKIYKSEGLEAFLKHEKENALKILPDGPFAPLLRAIAKAQAGVPVDQAPIRTALITARNSPAHERVIRTLHEWNVRVDEAHFLGGVSKHEILEAYGADIFFDDQDVHCAAAANVVPTAIVPIPEDRLDGNDNRARAPERVSSLPAEPTDTECAG